MFIQRVSETLQLILGKEFTDTIEMCQLLAIWTQSLLSVFLTYLQSIFLSLSKVLFVSHISNTIYNDRETNSDWLDGGRLKFGSVLLVSTYHFADVRFNFSCAAQGRL